MGPGRRFGMQRRTADTQRMVVTKDSDFRDSHLLTRSPRQPIALSVPALTIEDVGSQPAKG